MYKLSPSDFKYLWEECKHCFWRKVRHGEGQPSVFPRIFSHMSGLLQANVIGSNPTELCSDVPHGEFIREEGKLESLPLPSGKSYIKGRFDLLVRFADGTHGIIDLKMMDPNESGIEKFSRQLHAYKYALEHPAAGDPISISRLGLVILQPTDIRLVQGHVYYKAKPVWKEMPIDMPSFFSFIEKVELVLDGQEPNPQFGCQYCRYKHNLS